MSTYLQWVDLTVEPNSVCAGLYAAYNYDPDTQARDVID